MIRKEDGCESIEFFLEAANEEKIHLWEIWRDRAAWDAHMTNENSSQWRTIAADLVANEEITILTRP